MLTKPICIVMFLFTGLQLLAQQERSFHQNFTAEKYASVSINIPQEVTVEHWAGNTILTELSVEIYDVTPAVFKHFINEDRYSFTLEENGETAATIKYTVENRQPIRTREGEVYEFIRIRLLVPETFDISDPTKIVRQLEVEDAYVEPNDGTSEG